jgi:hypothetical protein
MTERDIEELVLKCLSRTHPEIGDRPLDPERPFADQFDFPPAGQQALAEAVGKELGLDISKAAKARLNSLEGWVRYLERTLS